jgi:PAS domain S-box-containing protein
MIELPNSESERRRLAMLDSLAMVGGPQEPSLVELAALASDLAGASIGLVSLLDSERLWIIGSHGFSEPQICRWDSFCTHAITRPQEVLWIPDALMDARFASNRYVVGEPNVRFYAGAPLAVNGCVVGVLCVLDKEPRPFDPVVAARLSRIARAAAAELTQRHRANALRQSLVASADGLIECDAHGRIIDWSQGAADLFGHAVDDAIGANINMIVPEAHREGHDVGLARWRASGAARLGRRLELPAVRRDGSTLDVELWMSVSHVEGEARIHANVRDISERKAQARELSAAKADAEAANRAKTAFLANMSHELRTPLNGVSGCAVLLSAEALTGRQAELVEIIRSSSDQLETLIADILDLSRIEEGAVRLVKAPVSLREIVEGAAALCGLKAAEKGVGLGARIDADADHHVMADGGRLKQVLVNLMSNAVKFTDSGHVEIRLQRREDRFRFEVSDTGIGFCDVQRETIFSRFRQADDTITRRFGGTGLGLAIARDLVEAMGGQLDCQSTPGAGSTFWVDIDLPLCEGDDAGAEGEDVEVDGLRILVVDDNETNRRVVELILASAGVETLSAADGLEALTVLHDQRVDVVLMDMMMPVMDGIEATRELRKREQATGRPKTPVIMLTANTLPDHVAMGLAAGANAHLAKPVLPATLFAALGAVLGGADEDAPQAALAS